MPTQERAVATRAAIIVGAATLFNERGFANTSIEMITEQAGVSRGAMYFHFRAKGDIANAVIHEQHRISRRYGETALSLAGSALEGMIRMSAGLARQLTTEVIVSAGIRLTTDGTASQLSATDPYRDWMQTFESLISLAIEQGDVCDTADPVRVAKFIIPAYTGVQLVSDALHNRDDLFQRVRDLWEYLIPGLVRSERCPAALQMLNLIAP